MPSRQEDLVTTMDKVYSMTLARRQRLYSALKKRRDRKGVTVEQNKLLRALKAILEHRE